MIIKLLEALKESPSFCNISDNQLKEAVLNSEHQTFQQSKNKNEYLYHINEKLKKIKQSSLQKYDGQGIDRSHNVSRSNIPTEDRSKIINGNVPSHVKISQTYSQDNPQQLGNVHRKIETFSTGMEMQHHANTVDSSMDTKQSYINDISMGTTPSYIKADPTKMQAFGAPQHNTQGYIQYPESQNSIRYQEFSPKINEFDPSKRANLQNLQRRMQTYNPSFNQENFNQKRFQGHISPQSIPEYNDLDKNGIQNGLNLYNKHPYMQSDLRNMKPKIDHSKLQDYEMYSNSMSEMGIDRPSMIGSHNTDMKQPIGFNEGNSIQKNTIQMFSPLGGKFKPDMDSDKFNNSQFAKRAIDPKILIPGAENDGRRVSSSVPFECQSYNTDGYKRMMQPPKLSQALKNQGSSFEYTYNPSNRSYIGNINPGLLDQTHKKVNESDFFNLAAQSKTDKNVFTHPFDEKKSERLFKSFSEEFMKGNKESALKSSIGSNDLKREVFSVESMNVDANSGISKQASPYTESSSKISETSNDSFESLDDEIPEELQLFLSQNNLSLKEIENEAEWTQLFKQVYSKYKDFIKNCSTSSFLFLEIIEMQNKFVFFPFINENDLKEFLKKMDSVNQKSECRLKMNKDDYLEFIDRAIEAFSEKRREESGVCTDTTSVEKKYE